MPALPAPPCSLSPCSLAGCPPVGPQVRSPALRYLSSWLVENVSLSSRMSVSKFYPFHCNSHVMLLYRDSRSLEKSSILSLTFLTILILAFGKSVSDQSDTWMTCGSVSSMEILFWLCLILFFIAGFILAFRKAVRALEGHPSPVRVELIRGCLSEL